MGKLSSIGAIVSICLETTKGTRPTANYKKIPGVSSVPEQNATPTQIDTTSLDDLEFTSSLPGLKERDMLTYTCKMSSELYDFYKATTTGLEAQAAGAAGKRFWICSDIKGLDKAAYTPVEISPLGVPGFEANSGVEVNIYFSPIGDPVWDVKPTYSA